MKRIRLTESQLHRLIEQALNELSYQTYMNAANKRHQNAMDYQRSEFDATGAERRRLEKWGSQPYGTPLKAKYCTYGGGYTPETANSEENMRSAYDLQRHAQNQYKKEHQTDKVPDSMYQWESLSRRVTEGVKKQLKKKINESYKDNKALFDSGAGLMLSQKTAEACNMSVDDAKYEVDCIIDNLSCDARKGNLSYEYIADELAGLGLDMEDENIEAVNQLIQAYQKPEWDDEDDDFNWD